MPSVNKESFLNVLESCQPGLGVREVIDQETCFVFQKGFVFSFNDETACKAPSPLGKNFVGVVQAQPLLDLLRKLSEEDLEISSEEGEGKFWVKGKNKKSWIRMEEDVRLPLSTVEEPKEWKPLNEDFGDAIKLVHQCAGKDDNHLNLTCVHVTSKWVEACDYSFQLCRWRLKTGFTDPVLMRRNAIRNVVDLGAREFSETESWVHFRSPHGLVLSCHRYTDVTDYPDIGKNLAIKGEPLELPKNLPEAIGRAEVFTASLPEGDNYVSVELKPGRLVLKGEAGTGGHREVKKVKYSGKPLIFMVPPTVLVDMMTNHKQPKWSVTEEHLIVNGGAYKFITCLAKDTKTHQTEESDE